MKLGERNIMNPNYPTIHRCLEIEEQVIRVLIDKTRKGDLKWYRVSEPYYYMKEFFRYGTLKDVFSVDIKNGQIRLLVYWDERLILDVTNFYFRKYKFPDIGIIKELFDCIRPADYYTEDTKLLGSILDGSIFTKLK